MLTNISLNHNEQKNTDESIDNNRKLYWNSFKDIVFNQVETEIIDLYDNREWKKEEIQEKFENYSEKWILSDYKNTNPIDQLRIFMRNLNFESYLDLFNQEIFKEKIDIEYQNLLNLFKKTRLFYGVFTQEDFLKLTEDDKKEYNNYEKLFFKISEIIFYATQTLIGVSYGMNASNLNHDLATPKGYYLMTNIWTVDNEQKKDHQILLQSLLDICAKKNYSKYKDLIYQPIYTEDKHYTLSCEYVKEIDDFVYEQISRDRNPLLYDLATKDKNTVEFIQKQLKKIQDSSLPFLKKERTLFSFNDGIYKLCVEEIDEQTNEIKYVDKFYPYIEKERPRLKPGTVSCKFFDIPMNYKKIDDWYNIPTDNLQKVLDLQFQNEKEYEEICRWMYILIGRLLYKIGELDDWQIIPFMKGLAGTGKGTLVKTSQKFYDPEDVGVLNNDGEKIFGLEPLYDKMLFVAPEIKGDISLPQASFQSMISGEDVSISRKHKPALSTTWEVPGILAGNEVPNWTDNSGSIARRLIIFAFNKKVPKSQVDPQLWKKIRENIPNILRKCNLAYLDAINKYAKKNIWEILPSYFKYRQEELSEQTNELKRFLKSPGVVYGKNYYISERELRSRFNDFIKENRKKFSYSTDKLNEPFQTLEEEFNTIIRLVKLDWRKSQYRAIENSDQFKDRKGTWIRGLSIQDAATNEIPEDEDFINFLIEVEKL